MQPTPTGDLSADIWDLDFSHNNFSPLIEYSLPAKADRLLNYFIFSLLKNMHENHFDFLFKTAS